MKRNDLLPDIKLYLLRPQLGFVSARLSVSCVGLEKDGGSTMDPSEQISSGLMVC